MLIVWVADGIGGIGDKEGLELNATDRRFVALVLKVRADGGLGMLDLSPRDLSHTGKFGFHPALHGTPDNRAQKSRHGVQLLQNGDEDSEADLVECCKRL